MVRGRRVSLFAVCVATALLAVATAAIGIRALATDSASAAYDEAVAAADSDGAAAWVATARFDRGSRRTELVVSRVHGGARPRLEPLPPAPSAAELEGNRSIGVAALRGGPCVQYSVRAAAVGEPRATISCFSVADGSWTVESAFGGQLRSGELVDSFAARGQSLFVALTGARGTGTRVVELAAGAAKDLGQVAASRRPGIFADFNAPASVTEQIPTVSVERNLGANRGIRVIRELAAGRWVDATRTIRSIYPAQSGGAARGSGRWVVTESRSLPERGISSFSVRATRGGAGRPAWRVLAPANVAATRGYSQGGAYSNRGRVRIAWSEQGRLARAGIPIRVYAARVSLRRDLVTGRQLLWSGRMKSFPPVPRIVGIGSSAYAVFERPAGREQAIHATVVKLK